MTAALSLRDEDLIREAKNEQAREDDAAIARLEAEINQLRQDKYELEATLMSTQIDKDHCETRLSFYVKFARRVAISNPVQSCASLIEEAQSLLRWKR